MGRQSAILNVVVALFPFAAGAVALAALSLGASMGLVAALVLSASSFGCLLAIKLPALKSGHLFGFGPAQASSGKGWLWWFALALLASAILMAGIAVRIQ